MNILHKAILHACWQKENEYGRHVARPWLRWFLTCVVGMAVIPARESERIQNDKEQWLAVRKEAALRIDPEKAEVLWDCKRISDPYGMKPKLYEEDWFAPDHFARADGSDVWVWFGDLPAAVRDRLWARIEAGEFKNKDNDLAFI